jgi:polyribonucleotide nucleotidyltransferase
MIGAVIGPGGKVIQDIQEKTGTTITITQEGDTGIVDIFAEDKAAIDEALRMVNGITEVPEVGKVYKGKIKSIVDFGAFVEILPGKEGLLHISEIEWRRVEKVSEVLKEGEEIEVKVIEVDKRNGKLKLSRKALLPRPEKPEKKRDSEGQQG